jgi:two-component system, NarL family, sensor histidine kinase DegS
MNEQLSALADELERDDETLQRELDEIDLLLRQASSEAERHESRRVQAEERLTKVERDAGTPNEAVADARAQLLSQTRRATLMQAQLDVLSGKQRTLQRYRERVAATLPVVRAVAGAEEQPQLASGHSGGADSGEVLAAQEQMRRAIARQMHDGPAQSIANIALQAQIVQRLFERDPSRAGPELDELVTMVQQALDATKSFIFDVRPMVLDDLGLVPTLRRSASERSRRSGLAIRFESVGTDRRLPTDVESALFRIVDDTVVGYLGAHATGVLVRFDWSEQALRVTVSGTAPGAEQTADQKARAAVAAARRDRAMPHALASMIHEQEHQEAARHAGLSESVRIEIEQRAAALGMQLTVADDGWQVELLLSAHR